MGRPLLRVLALLAVCYDYECCDYDYDYDVCCDWAEYDEWPPEAPFPCPADVDLTNATLCCGYCYPADACPLEDAGPEPEPEQGPCPGEEARPAATSASALSEHLWSSPFFVLGMLGAAILFLCMLLCRHHHHDACLPGSDSDSAPAVSSRDGYSRLRDHDPPPSYGTCATVAPQCSVTGALRLQNVPRPSTDNPETPVEFHRAASGTPRKDNVMASLPPLLAPEGTAASGGPPEPTLPAESCNCPT